MSSYQGFGIELTKDELAILKAFGNEPEIAFPVGCNLSFDETIKVLRSLTKKDVVVGRGPYRLTKLGRRIVNKDNNMENT